MVPGRAAFVRRPRDTAGPGHVLRGRPGDHRRLAHRACHHGDRRRQAPGRRVPGHVPHARQPRAAPSRRPSRCSPASPRPWSPRPPASRACCPPLVEFVGGSVLVGHNVRFDIGFLNAALSAPVGTGWRNSFVDTVALARRLVRDEVPNCRLGTLSDRFRLDHRPSHRALEDALATADLLHLLLERAAAWGVLGLDDLLVLPRLAGHPQAAKLRLTDHAAPDARRLLVRGRARRAALRGQGGQPAPAGALVLLGRRPPQDRQPPAGDGRRPSPGRGLDAGGGGGRGAAHPPPPAPLQPPGHAVARRAVRGAHPGRGLPPAQGGAGATGRRLALPRAVADAPAGRRRRRGHPHRRPAAALHRTPRPPAVTPPPCRPVPARPTRRGPLPVLRPHRPGRLRRHGGPGGRGADRPAGHAARPAPSAAGGAGRRPPLRGGCARARPGRRRWRPPCGASAGSAPSPRPVGCGCACRVASPRS